MCRLSAITATDIPLATRKLLLDRLMLAGNADDKQDDGFGLATSQEVLFRSASRYLEISPNTWMRALGGAQAKKELLIGHVRKASHGTGRTVDENHPYKFDVLGEPLIFAHNGQFRGTVFTKVAKGDPDTDSFRAANDLVIMLRQAKAAGDGALRTSLIEEWLSLYYSDSAYVVFILYRNELIVIRGPDTRDMHFVEMGNGYAFHTSSKVLEGFMGYARALDVNVADKYFYVVPHTIVRVSAGSHVYTFNRFMPEYRTYTTTKNYSSGASAASSQPAVTTSPAPLAPRNSTVQLKDDPDVGKWLTEAAKWEKAVDSDPDGELFTEAEDTRTHVSDDGPVEDFNITASDSPSILFDTVANETTYRPRIIIFDNRQAAVINQKRRELVDEIKRRLNPMRTTMIAWWLAEKFNCRMKSDDPKVNGMLDLRCLFYLDLGDLNLFLDVILPTIGDADKRSLTAKQRELVQIWNRKVPRGKEFRALTLFVRMFGSPWVKTDVSKEVFESYVELALSEIDNFFAVKTA